MSKGLYKVWFLDAQDCPQDVKDEVRELWAHNELGNDNYVYKTYLEGLSENNGIYSTEAIARYIRETEPNIQNEDKILIHWWW